MDKHELAQRLARRSHQSKGNAADQVDALIYKLIKSREPKQPARTRRDGNVPGLPPELSKAPVKKS